MYRLVGEEKTCRKSPSDSSLCSWTESSMEKTHGGGGCSLLVAGEGGRV